MITRRALQTASRAFVPLRVFFAAVMATYSCGVQAQTSASTSAAVSEVSTGVTALRAGDLATAQEAFGRAVKVDPKLADAWVWKGIAESQATHYATAVSDLRTAVALRSESVPAHYNLALNLIRLQRNDEAIRELQTVLGLQPDALDPRYNLAVLLEATGDPAGAATHLARAHQLAPHDPRLTLRLLADLERAGLHEKTQALVREIVQSGDDGLVTGAATSLLASHQFAEAESLLHAVSSGSGNTERTALLARVYIGETAYPKAIALLASQTATSQDAELEYLLGLAQVGAQQKSEAAHSFSAAVALRPEMAAPHYHLGLLAAEFPSGQDRAATELERAHTLEPADPVYALAYARLLLERDHADQVQSVLAQAATDLTPQQAAEAHLIASVALLSAGATTDALPILQQIVSGAGSQLALAHNLLGFCFFRNGRYMEAAKEYKIASDQQARHRVFARDTALAYSHTNLNDEALFYANRAASLPEASAADLSLKAKLEARAGRRQEAVQDLQHAIALDPQLDSAYYLLARTYQQLGDHEQAVAWNNKLTALKQSKAQAYAQTKSSERTMSSSSLLQGSALTDENGSAP